MKISLLPLVLVCMVAFGCISKRSGGAAFNEGKWSEGVTTRRDVVSRWGNPDAMRDDVWIWREIRHLGGKVKASYYGIGIIVSKMNVAVYEHHLRFDESGVLVEREIHCSSDPGEEWSLNPFN